MAGQRVLGQRTVDSGHLCLLSFVFCPETFVICPLSSVHCLLSFVFCPLSSVLLLLQNCLLQGTVGSAKMPLFGPLNINL